MPRTPRRDSPGAWHHVMNRGIARRTVFESSRDVRYLLACLAREVRAGHIELHAFAVMTTHFHLLVRSRDGALSQVMQRATNDYVRWFNRRRERDGPLFRGRFRSYRVDSFEYRRSLVEYIDSNPVTAGLAAAPELYRHCSAWHYARKDGPAWLEREWVEARVRAATGGGEYEPGAYGDAFDSTASAPLAHIVERRIELNSRAPDPLDDLLGSAPDRVVDWMKRKADLADGVGVAVPVCDAGVVSSLVELARRERGAWNLQVARKAACAWRSLHVALLRELCGSSWQEVALRTGLDIQTAIRAHRNHVRALVAVPDYADAINRIGVAALSRCFTDRGRGAAARRLGRIGSARDDGSMRIEAGAGIQQN
ncbi:MAG: hypothetical protein EPO68_00975 [Planctomycetota bacterium]|nr:MAG: hypothetical protein EPO68_00975 [Planctomycetota bacterium]